MSRVSKGRLSLFNILYILHRHELQVHYLLASYWLSLFGPICILYACGLDSLDLFLQLVFVLLLIVAWLICSRKLHSLVYLAKIPIPTDISIFTKSTMHNADTLSLGFFCHSSTQQHRPPYPIYSQSTPESCKAWLFGANCVAWYIKLKLFKLINK